MKFKFDFVTNSSSTCFVVFIPNSFTVTNEMIQAGIDDAGYWWELEEDEEFPTVETIRNEIEICIGLLKDGDNIYQSYNGGVDFKVYGVVDSILSTHSMYINSIELSSSGDNTILGIKEAGIIELFINHIDITNFIKVEK